VIVDYRNKRTKDFAIGKRVKEFSGIERAACLKLDRLEAAVSLKDLAALHPGEHLAEEIEALNMSAADFKPGASLA
jgi:proteic killer suppression protein